MSISGEAANRCEGRKREKRRGKVSFILELLPIVVFVFLFSPMLMLMLVLVLMLILILMFVLMLMLTSPSGRTSDP